MYLSLSRFHVASGHERRTVLAVAVLEFHAPVVGFTASFLPTITYVRYRYLARSLTFILPYVPTGTMERIDHEGQIATAKVRDCEYVIHERQGDRQ